MAIRIIVTEDHDIYMIEGKIYRETSLEDIKDKNLIPENEFTKKFLNKYIVNAKEILAEEENLRINHIFISRNEETIKHSLDISLKFNPIYINDISGYYEGPYYTLFYPNLKFFNESSNHSYKDGCDRLIIKDGELEISDKIEKTTEEFICYVAQTTNNYTTWLIDVLPRIYIAKTQKTDSKLIIPLNSNMEDLLLFDIYEDNLVRTLGHVNLLKDASFISIPQIHDNLPSRYNLKCYDFLKEKYDTHLPPKRILIIDGIANHSQVYEILKPLGFEILSNNTLRDNISIFSAATIIVSAGNDNLSNLVFCNPESLIVEIGQKINSYHFRLSLYKNINYVLFECPNAINGKFLVKVNQLANVLKKLI